ncbi:hypothetical protein FMEXI_4095 [Fusarium mexicanum]|uniref:Uncharacterized protein n=1 Tax=Fusarium mexicanum TaxID=751941 RepID=A0A8H5J8Z7_9HYPO|nr:hypothetical protein FMEXI_4095 [Fusarium mexicanum]
MLTSPAQISTTETRRIQRAFYRYQLFCNLFGAVIRKRHDNGTNDERLQRFLRNFEPWEIEEILCINEFVQDKYKDVLDDVTWDFHPDDPETRVRRKDLFTLLRTYGAELFDKSYIIGMSSLGLTALSAIFEAQGQVALIELVSQHVAALDGDWLFEATKHHKRRGRLFTDSDEAPDSQEPMPFRGDGEHLPPLAWVFARKDTYSNLYGAYSIRSLREWGYVMWDASRLTSSGGADILNIEWEDFCTESEDDL